MNDPIFVVGAPRSGTTLLRVLLAAHPRIAIPDETHFFDRWLREFGHLDLAEPRAFDAFWSAFASHPHFRRLGLDPDMERRRIRSRAPVDFRTVFATLLEDYAASLGKPRWGEKTPGHFVFLDTIFDWFPDARTVALVRDPRAVYASRKGTEWGARPPRQVARNWVRAARAAARWSGDGRGLVVRYEDLVGETEAVMQRVCRFVGETFDAAVVEPGARQQVRASGLHGTHDPSGAVDTAAVERWRRELAPVDIAVIEDVAGDAMRALGYDPLGTSLGRGARLHAVGDARRHAVVTRVRRLRRRSRTHTPNV